MVRLATAIRAPAETRGQLRAAARSLFAERGFDGVGVRDLAEQAGVNAALVQYHFGSKQGLLNDILRDDFDWALARLREAVDRRSGARAQLAAFIETLAEVGRQRPWFPFIIAREQIGGARYLEPDVRERLFDFFRITSAIFESGWKRGEIRRVNLHATHLSLMGALMYFALTQPARAAYEQMENMPGERLTSEDYVRHVRELFERGLLLNTPATSKSALSKRNKRKRNKREGRYSS